MNRQAENHPHTRTTDTQDRVIESTLRRGIMREAPSARALTI